MSSFQGNQVGEDEDNKDPTERVEWKVGRGKNNTEQEETKN